MIKEYQTFDLFNTKVWGGGENMAPADIGTFFATSCHQAANQKTLKEAGNSFMVKSQ